MRRIGWIAASVAVLATGQPAWAQVRDVVRTILIAPVPEPAPLPQLVRGVPLASPVARLWSFDSDGDDRVAVEELPERMQPLMARGDANKDGYLDAGEIEGLVDKGPVRFEVNRSSALGNLPAGLPGVVSDLRLAQPTHDQAMALVRSTSAVRNVNDPVSLDQELMYARLRELLGEEEYENFRAAAARRHASPGGVVGGVVVGLPGR